MSGGHFDYKQYSLDFIADSVEQLIIDNGKTDEWGDRNNFSKETLAEFQVGIKLIKKAAIYAQRIDWLVSGDDGEDNFHARLKCELEVLTESTTQRKT
jgi:hypothetical protein